MKKHHILIGIAIALLTFIIHFSVAGDYGITWDFHHIFFAGLKFIGRPLSGELTDNIPFGKPSPWDMFDVPFGQFMPVLASGGWRLFFESWHLLPFDVAFHLTTIILGSLGVGVLYLLMLRATNFRTALLASLFLALYPRYFADTQNNIKDVPQAVLFSVSMLLLYLTANKPTTVRIAASALVFAVAFNIKINALFIPVVFGAWIVGLLMTGAGKKLDIPLSVKPVSRLLRMFWYFPIAIILALLFWFLSWNDAIRELLYIPTFFSENTKNMEVLYYGNWFCSTVNIPWYYPFGYLAAVTPVPILLFAMIGIIISVVDVFRKKPFPSLLLLWLFVPLARFTVPHMGVIDGIRHFEEVIYPLMALAAIGFSSTLTVWETIPYRTIRFRRILSVLAISGTILYLGLTIIRYHPNQLAYYNEFIGGAKGALGRFDLDYWGSSQKEAILWINEHVPKDAYVHVIMIPDVAAKYIRPDLLPHLNAKEFDASDYVVFLNRQSFFYRYFYSYEYLNYHKPVYTVSVSGAPLVWVFDNSLPKTERQAKWWQGDDPCIRRYW
jgi:hypothetical protein